jgi:hypothetical protein
MIGAPDALLEFNEVIYLADAPININKFEEHPLTDYQAIRKNALRFSDQRFRDEIKQYVQQCYLEYYKRPIDAIV